MDVCKFAAEMSRLVSAWRMPRASATIAGLVFFSWAAAAQDLAQFPVSETPAPAGDFTGHVSDRVMAMDVP